MVTTSFGRWFSCMFLFVLTIKTPAQQESAVATHLIDRGATAQKFFGNDAPWYQKNIPFLDIDDPAIERTYYYRWQLYRSHIRRIGSEGTDETEFLASVPWARHPYEDLNDSSSFHILEGRWLRDPAYVTSLVDHLYAGAGNDRHFSESVASATLALAQVTGDPRPALRHLDAMEHIYNLWDDHFDASRNLYWIEPLLDATEYTISSIDASGAGFTDKPSPTNNGFFGGFAFRPSINAYQYGNARAIAEFARLAGEEEVAKTYDQRANRLRAATLAQLWNPALQHFTDIYQRSTATVAAGEFIRGRELAGFVPWQFELPPQHPEPGDRNYDAAWQHLLSHDELSARFGLRTAEPSYARYLVQYRYDAATGRPECQWNGPSWPFQTSQTLSGMANLLHDYPHNGMTATDYVHLLRQYTQQHEIAPGKLDLQEDYNPDTGKPIVGLPRSHHYNHSTYIDLVLSGLLGIQPHADDIFEINPLLPPVEGKEPSIRYFTVEGLQYHGHEMTVVYDSDGSHYHVGAGVQIFSDGKYLLGPVPLGDVRVPIKTKLLPEQRLPVDRAVNVWGRAPSPFEPDLTIATSSSTASDSNLYEPIDGREWFFPEVPHGWSPMHRSSSSTFTDHKKSDQEWYAVDLRHEQLIGEVALAFLSDNERFSAPGEVAVQVLIENTWTTLAPKEPAVPVANGETRIRFKPIRAKEVRVQFRPPEDGNNIRLISLGIF